MKKIILISLFLFLKGCSPLYFVCSDEDRIEYGSDPLLLVEKSNADKIEAAFLDKKGNAVDEAMLTINEEYQLIFYVKKGKLEKQFEKTITFCDTQAPTVLPQKLTLQLEYGTEFDSQLWLEENLFFQDNVTPKDKLIIEGIEQLSSIQEGIFDLIIKDESQNSNKISIQVILKDTTAPIITAKKTNFLIDEYDTIPDFSVYAYAWDNKDGEVKIEIKKEKDFQGPGQYQLFFSATDQAQNEAILPFTCIISSKNTHENTDENSSAPLTKADPELKIDDDFFELDQRNLNACIEHGKQSGSCNWECIPNGDGTYIYMQYD